MKITIIVALILLLNFNKSQAQKNYEPNKSMILTKLDGEKSEAVTQNIIIGPKTLKSMETLSDFPMKYGYNSSKKSLFTKVVPNEGINLIRFTNILDHFSISEDERMNKIVKIDGKKIDNPEDIIADLSAIVSCKVNKTDASIEITTYWSTRKRSDKQGNIHIR